MGTRGGDTSTQQTATTDSRDSPRNHAKSRDALQVFIFIKTFLFIKRSLTIKITSLFTLNTQNCKTRLKYWRGGLGGKIILMACTCNLKRDLKALQINYFNIRNDVR